MKPQQAPHPFAAAVRKRPRWTPAPKAHRRPQNERTHLHQTVLAAHLAVSGPVANHRGVMLVVCICRDLLEPPATARGAI
jgi:hypothetical protein